MANSMQISSLIVKQLALGEKRILGLVVGVRTALGISERVKGDLTEVIRAALRKLVASKAVVDTEGSYSLPPAK